MPYKNEKTFLYFDLIGDLAKNDLIALDGYAFSIEELKQYGKESLDTFFKNPHEISQTFSPEAITILEKHPDLKNYAQQHKNKLASQKHGVSLNTVSAVMDLLLGLETQENESRQDPRATFLGFKDNLTREEQNKLDCYVIKVPHLASSSGHLTAFPFPEASLAFFSSTSPKIKKPTQYQERTMTFAEAFMGGSHSAPCQRTFKIFLWQFVLNFNPKVLDRIPQSVKKIALADRYLLGGSPEIKLAKQAKFTPPFSSISETEEQDEIKQLRAEKF